MSILIACQSSNNYKTEIKNEVNKGLEKLIVITKKICKEHFDKNKVLQDKEMEDTFFDILDKVLRRKIDEEVNHIVSSLNFSDNDSKTLLECLKSHSGENQSDECLNLIAPIMMPISIKFDKIGEESYFETIDELINKLDIVDENISKLECSTLKKGQFYYMKPFIGDSVKIIRTQKEQVEIDKQDTVIFNIEWKNNCTYELAAKDAKSDTTLIYEMIDKVESGYRYISKMYVNNKLTRTDIGVVR